MAGLADHLAGKAGRPVIDKTGPTAEYDFRLEWASEQAADSTLPSLFTALQEQLGLKLESTKGPVGMIVVETPRTYRRTECPRDVHKGGKPSDLPRSGRARWNSRIDKRLV